MASFDMASGSTPQLGHRKTSGSRFRCCTFCSLFLSLHSKCPI
uniref:Uncharacterized protein n=1 Tax=Anguilla anguilla TaxID=7936 RepID=A0A0E9R312_ANGAN